MLIPPKKQPRRLRVASLAASIISLLCGLTLLILSFFAPFLGLDHDPGWGTSRILLALLGVGCCLAALAVRFYSGTGRLLKAGYHFSQRVADHATKSALARRFQPFLRNPKVMNFFQERDTVFAWLGCVVCIIIALWFITAGWMLVWTTTTHYFDQQADAYLAGQLSLLEQPSQELLGMANPYDWQARIDQNVSHLWDASLFDGRYYLYWGPVPALLAAGIKSITTTSIDDSALVFIFYCGVVVFLTLLLRIFRRKIYPQLPAWLLLPLVMFGGLSAPLLWLINRPSVYETAIAGGQFFLLIGLFTSLQSVYSKKLERLMLVITGFAWGAAIGCRLNLAPAISFLVLALTVYWWKTRTFKRMLVLLVWLFAPLLLWVLGISWYNFARFGNILESGHRYQLTGPSLPDQYSHVISLQYSLPSLYSYLIRPPLFSLEAFPFVSITFIKENMWPFFIFLPKYYYYPEPVAGLLIVTPAIWLLILPVMGSIRNFWHWLNLKPLEKNFPAAEDALGWGLMVGGSLFLFSVLLVFNATTFRYMADVLPMLTLLVALCLGWGLKFLEKWRIIRQGLLVIAVFLLITSVVIGLLTGFTAGDAPFEIRNPVLFRSIQNFFR